MKQVFTRLYILLAILLCGGSFAWADEVTFTIGNDNTYDIFSNNGTTKNGISITMTNGVNYEGNPMDNSWFKGYFYLRPQGTIVFKPQGVGITKIQFECTGTNNESTWSSSVGNNPEVNTSAHNVTWIGNATGSLVLTNIGGSLGKSLSSIRSITVTYTPLTPQNINASINAYGYATFSCEYETTVPDGVTAYTGAVDEVAKTITWTAIADGIIPANEGVLLKGTASSTVTLTESYTSKAKIGGNDLIANLEDKTKADLGNYIYVLSGPEIVRLSDTGKLKANRAYFSMETDIAATGATMRMIWNDAAATVIDVANTAANSNVCYNLNGQRVAPALTGKAGKGIKGVVIINGKKVIQ